MTRDTSRTPTSSAAGWVWALLLVGLLAELVLRQPTLPWLLDPLLLLVSVSAALTPAGP